MGLQLTPATFSISSGYVSQCQVLGKCEGPTTGLTVPSETSREGTLLLSHRKQTLLTSVVLRLVLTLQPMLTSHLGSSASAFLKMPTFDRA